MNMNMKLAVANRIRELCLTHNIKPGHLSTISAVPPSTLKNILNGTSNNPGIVTIKKLCDGLDISIVDFFNTELFLTLEQEIK